MIRYGYVIVALALITAVGCSRVQVSQDYRKTADFSNIYSYAWTSDVQEKSGDIRVDNPLMDERIRAAVAANLSAKGLRAVPAGEADVKILYNYQIRQKIRSDDTRGGLAVGYGAYSRGGGIVFSTGWSREPPASANRRASQVAWFSPRARRTTLRRPARASRRK